MEGASSVHKQNGRTSVRQKMEGPDFSRAVTAAREACFRSAEGWSEGEAGTTELPSSDLTDTDRNHCASTSIPSPLFATPGNVTGSFP
jgi:hypothetical protein